MKELHLFAGLGGGILGGMLLGHTPVCAVEIDKYCQRVLRQRQADGLLPPDMAIHDDITTFSGKPWRGKVDVVCGGWPCQDLSVAGKGAGLDGKRSGLFFELMRVVCEIQPRYVFLENVPALLVRGFDRVLRAVAENGFDAAWSVLSASDCGANHQRKRLWILCKRQVADTECIRPQGQRASRQPGDSAKEGDGQATDALNGCVRSIWAAEPALGRVADGIPDRVGRLRGLGNAQVPIVAATAFKLLERTLR